MIKILSLLAHEYAHQWFGDHVAPTWWQFLWLNEGFATLFESYATGLVYPEWRSMETFVTGVVHYVFQSDSLNPRPMSDYVESPGAIGNLFDDVPYEKAGAVLRMLQTVMTEETFAKGLKLYLDENRENNANPDDLYRNLQRAIDDELLVLTPNITGFMKTWEMQAGFPVVNVARSNNALTITQQRYFRDPSSSSPVIWWIPLNYVVGSNPDFSKTTPDFWLIEKSSTIQNSSAPNRKFWNSEDWILFNIKETGYYRVNYDLNLWKLLSDELTIGNHTKIDVVNRAQLIDDSFNLARSQHLQYSVPFDILSYLKLENEYDPWTAASRALSFLRPTLFNSQYFNLFQKFMLENVNLLFTKYGLTSKSSDRFLDKFARNIAINWACSTSHVQCLSDTTALMVRVVDDHKIEPDLQFSIYCNGLRQATKATFDKFWEQALLSAEKSVMLSALGCSHDSALLKNYLETTMAAPNQDNQLLVVDAILGNGQLAGLNVLIDYVTKNSSFVFVRVKELVVNSIAMRVVNSDQLSKVGSLIIFNIFLIFIIFS